MDKSQITRVAREAEQLFEIVMNLYWGYLEGLEKAIQRIPESETEILKELQQHMQEIQAALEHDIAIFEKAVQNDLEDLNQLKDQLKIDALQKQLKQK